MILNHDIARGWLAALIDGEGCIYFRRKGNVSVRVVTVTSTDKELIDCAAYCYEMFGIEYSLSERPGATANRKHRWIIDVRKAAAMQRILDEIPLQHRQKLHKLRESLTFARGLRCKACNCLHDECTKGCADCRKRHQMRGYAKAARLRMAQTKAAEGVNL